MRNYGSLSLGSLIIKGLIALVLILVLVQVFKAVFAIVAALLTISIIGLGIYMLMNLLGRKRY